MTSYVESAYYGDEKAFRNITGILADKLVGTTLNVNVDEKLIPPFVAAPKTELDLKEEAEIRGRAASRCNNDKECIDRTESQMRQEALRAKESSATTAVNTIKGRRLTVNVIDSTGKRRQIVVPDGQKFALEDVMVTDPKKGKFQVPPLKFFQNQLYTFGTVVAVAFLYVFSVVATYTVFARRLGPFIAAGATVVAVFTPFSGFFMIIAYFGSVAAAKTYVELSSQGK